MGIFSRFNKAVPDQSDSKPLVTESIDRRGRKSLNITIPNDVEGQLFVVEQLRRSGMGVEGLVMMGLATDEDEAQALFDKAESHAWMADQTSGEAWEEAIAVADKGLERHNATLQYLTDTIGLGPSGTRWDVDMKANEFRWTGTKGVAICPVQILGTRNPANDSWLWGWRHEEILPELRTAAEAVRVWGEQRGLLALTEPEVPCLYNQGRMFGNLAVGLGLGDFTYVGGEAPEVFIVLSGIQCVPL